MATTISSTTYATHPVLSLLLLLLLLLATSSSSLDISAPGYRSLLAVQQQQQQQRRGAGRRQIPNCGEMVTGSQCSQNPACRWCKSDALDDMCFSKTESWRLPRQVFVCE
ncbi:hypothetical protein Tsubulata_009818 [Turnera subulata]|uniref:Uncharacterized protein n=1 Tax=Turnera subulata TaxID=218843 RepID=A0A9Q0G6E6_9ROSI|nr:hypothetical protein Tsubulata_009818 [Turnera subulata]